MKKNFEKRTFLLIIIIFLNLIVPNFLSENSTPDNPDVDDKNPVMSTNLTIIKDQLNDLEDSIIGGGVISQNYTIYLKSSKQINLIVNGAGSDIVILKSYENLRAVSVQSPKQVIEQTLDLLDIKSYAMTKTLPRGYRVPLDQSIDEVQSLDIITNAIDNISQINNLNGYQLNSISDATGIKIGVVDNGVDISHPVLQNLIIHQSDFNDGNPVGSQSHGTSVVSAIGGMDGGDILGVATGATIYSAAMGSPMYEPGSIAGDFLAAFDYLIAENVTVINTSFGGPTKIWDGIVNQLNDLGIILVGSAGNDFISGNDDEFSISGPGSHQFAISVAGTDEYDEYWSGSLEGPNMNGISKPDFVAQAENVYTAWYNSNEIIQRDGTSFASPLLVGGIASLLKLMEAEGKEHNMAIIKSLLAKNSNAINSAKGVNQIGFGLPDLFSAAQDIINNKTDSVFITPQNAPKYYYKTHLRNSTQQMELNYFTSLEVGDLGLVVSGNISDIIVQTGNITEKSQFLPLQIRSNMTTMYGKYIGNITLFSKNNNSVNSLSLISIVIDRDKIGTVMVDFRYSDYDTNWYGKVNSEIPWDEIFGAGSGKLIEILWNEGFQVTFNDNDLSKSILDKIDILVLLDFIPSSLYYDAFDNLYIDAYTVETENVLKQFVGDGGSLYIDFNGYVGSTTTESIHSSNIFAMQSLLSEYNMKAFEYKITEQDFLSRSQVYNLNESNSISTVESLDYSGNFLQRIDYNDLKSIVYFELSPIYNPEIELSNLYPALFYDQFNSGRVAVFSSTLHRNNCALGTDASFCTSPFQYPNSIDDRAFVKDVFKWLLGNNRTIISNVSMDENNVVIQVQSHNIDNVQLYMKKNSELATIDDIISINTFTSEYTVDVFQDQVIDLEVRIGNEEYQKKRIYVDIIPPVINDLQKEKSEFQIADKLIFNINDIYLQSIDVQVDGQDYDYTDLIEWENGTLSVYVYLYPLMSTNHQIQITATDTKRTSIYQKTIFMIAQETKPQDSNTPSSTIIYPPSSTDLTHGTSTLNPTTQIDLRTETNNKLKIGVLEVTIIATVIILTFTMRRKN